MKTIVLYRQQSEHRRMVEEFIHEYTRRSPERRIEVLDIDSRDGYATASLYDVTSYPAVLALRDDGSISMVWQGEQMPLLDEVASYALA